MKLVKDLGMLYATPTSKRKYRYGLYECPKCNRHIKVMSHNTKTEHSNHCHSCSKKTHGLNGHKLYQVWAKQKARCNTISNKNYKHYGARGIEFADEFNNFVVWLDYIESLPNANKPTYSIDRKNNNKGYEKGNLRWANQSTQARNTRKLRVNNTSGYRGVTKNGKRWQAKIVINNNRIYLGAFDYPWTAAYAYDAYVLKHSLEHTRNFNKDVR